MRALTAVLLLAGLCAVSAARAEVALDASNSWEFKPPADSFADNAVLDLRPLNEKVAGGKGYVRLSQDGNSFVLGDGAPVRFWGVHATSKAEWSDADAARNARWLAKLGVNLVRCGAQLSVTADSAEAREANEKSMRELQRTVAVMKQAGIYTMISPIWATGNEGRIWFDPSFQAPYKALVKQLLTAPNPYTGIALKDDPALAFFEICNEDNMLFYWVDSIKGAPLQLLQQKFAQWAAAKYGSAEKALAAWGGGAVSGDAPQEGRLGMMVIWYATWDGKQKDPNPKRMRDQLQFFAETERAFGLEMKRYLSQDLGCKALMDTSDFRPADQALMGDLTLWCKSAGDLICTNSYYDPGHKGANTGWRIDPGDTFVGASAINHPLLITALKKQLVGRPYVLTETLWVPPTAYEAEAPLLLASYMGLSGLDAALIAGPRGVDLSADPYFPWWTLPGGHPLGKFNCMDPGTMTSFPAAALIQRLGYVQQSRPVVHEERTLDDLLDLKPPMIADAADFDPNQYAQFYHANPALPGGVPPQAFLVGRVEVAIGDRPGKSSAVDLSPYIKGSKVSSITGELSIDSAAGIFTLNATRAQGVAGFLKAAGGRFALADVTIESGNDYAAVVAVPLDGQPLAGSHRVLVQVGTISRPTEWRVEASAPAGDRAQTWKILTTGHLPWRVANTDVTVTVADPNLSKAVRLDANGYAAGDVPVQTAAGKLTVRLPADAMYLVLQ